MVKGARVLSVLRLQKFLFMFRNRNSFDVFWVHPVPPTSQKHPPRYIRYDKFSIIFKILKKMCTDPQIDKQGGLIEKKTLHIATTACNTACFV